MREIKTDLKKENLREVKLLLPLMHCRKRIVSLSCLGTRLEKRHMLMGDLFCVLLFLMEGANFYLQED